jgi:hypothetical protein
MNFFPRVLLFSLFPFSVLAQNTTFTYQGRVLDHGTNFNGVGLCKFALVTSSNSNTRAAATAHLTGAFVTSCTIDAGGNGYVTPPAVTFSGGGGSGAAATANLTGGAVTSITMNNAGSGYTSAPIVTIAAPPQNLTYITYWSNDGTSTAGSEPSAAVSVNVATGLFTVVLGDTNQAGMLSMDAGVFSQPGLQLRIWFNDGVSGSTVLSPVQNLTPAPYAIVAQSLAPVVQNNYLTSGEYVAVGGGSQNTASNYFTTVGGGELNVAGGFSATVAGGEENNASGNSSFVGGGYANYATGAYSAIGGGNNNSSATNFSTVAGGYLNLASNYGASVGGGYHNTASGYLATVAGGYGNTASGNYSFAGGTSAQAAHPGSFVWADTTGGSFASSANDEFSVRANGGVRLAADVQIGLGSGDYHHLTIGGGNSSGFLYGAYPYYGDGIHIGYNFYSDASGSNHVINPGGGTTRISMTYGTIELATSIAAGLWPNTWVTLDSAGRLGIDRASTANTLEVGGNASKAAAGSWLANSDRRIKTGIATVTNALETLNQVRLVSFRYNDDYRTSHRGIDDRTYLNVVAQEFAQVFPDYVKGSGEKLPDGNEILQVDTQPLTIYSAAAVQELSQKVAADDQDLRENLKRLSRENAELRQRLETLEKIVYGQKSN